MGFSESENNGSFFFFFFLNESVLHLMMQTSDDALSDDIGEVSSAVIAGHPDHVATRGAVASQL